MAPALQVAAARAVHPHSAAAPATSAARRCQDPALIMLDEPLSGLDSEMSAQVAACLARLAARNKTVMLSLHHSPGCARAGPPAAGRCVCFGATARRSETTAPSPYLLPPLTCPPQERAALHRLTDLDGAGPHGVPGAL